MSSGGNDNEHFDPQLEMMVAPHPKWGNARSIAILALGISIAMFCTGTLYLLIKRRKFYPLPHRKAGILIIWNITSLIGTLMITASTLVYSNPGPPCGQGMALIWSFLPYVFGVMFRGWTMIFQIEIQSYLTERTWRQYRERILLGRNEQSSSHPLCQIPCLDPKSLPGEWCITHRKWMEPGRVTVGVCSIAFIVFLVIIYTTVINDTDIVKVNAARNALGMTDLPFRESFSSDGFFHGPHCMQLSRCAKCHIYPALMVPFFIFILGVVWRVKVNANRVTRRVAEQQEFSTLYSLDEQEQLLYNVGSRSVSHAAIDSTEDIITDQSHLSILPQSLTSTSAVSLTTPMDIDELHSVLYEFRTAFIVSVVGQLASVLLVAILPQWSAMVGSITFFNLAYIFCLSAVRQSYNVSRRQMASRGKVEVRSRNAVAPQPDEQPTNNRFHNLRNVINDEHTYLVLLKFLQKEYSSENALFYYEAKRFAYFCRTLEKCIGLNWKVTTILPHDIALSDAEASSVQRVKQQVCEDVAIIRQFKRESEFGSTNLQQRLPLPVASMSLEAMHEYAAHACTWALQIYTDYIQENAIYQVNVSSKIFQQVQARHKVLKAWNPSQNKFDRSRAGPTPLPSSCEWTLSTLYSESEDAVFQLIQSDSFTRFVITKEFAQMLHDQEERTRKIRANHGHTVSAISENEEEEKKGEKDYNIV